MKPISKSLLRKILLDYRRLLDMQVHQSRNESLCENLLRFIRKNDFKTVHTFLPIERNKEPDISDMFSELRRLGCEIVVSRTDFATKTQSHFYLREDTLLNNNRMGIPEPVNAQIADFEVVDLVLVPLLVADKCGSRIGYGGGFYDKLLQHSMAKKIGLSLSPLLDEIEQIEEWDVKLDTVLTPFEIDF